jgi:TldD protein
LNKNDNSIDTLMSRMLEPAGLDEANLSTTLGSMMKGGVDYADLYFQVSRNESWTLEDGIIREGSFNLDQGVGVRATSGEKTGFAYSDELVMPALQQAAGAARAIARQGQDKSVQAWSRTEAVPLYPSDDPTTSIDDSQKTALLSEIDAATRELDKRVEQVIVSLASSQDLILVAASDGMSRTKSSGFARCLESSRTLSRDVKKRSPGTKYSRYG